MRLSDNLEIDLAHDDDGTYDGTTVTMVDMAGYSRCLVLAMPCQTKVDATNYLAAFKIVSNSASDGSGTDHDICEAVTTSGGTTTTLTGADMYGTATATIAAGVNKKYLALEVRSEDLYPGDRYIAAKSTKGGTQSINYVYIRVPDHAQKDALYAGTRYAFEYLGNL